MTHIGRLFGPLATFALIVCMLCAVACGSPAGGAGPPPDVAADTVPKGQALAFNGVTAALLTCNNLLAAHLRSLPSVDAATYARLKAVSARLDRVRDLLDIVRRWLKGESKDPDVPARLKEAVEALKVVVAELEASGVAGTAEAKQALELAGGVL